MAAETVVPERGATIPSAVPTALKRRGILAAAGVAVAAIVAKRVAVPVGAVTATGNTDGQALIIGANTAAGNTPNYSVQPTILRGDPSSLFASDDALVSFDVQTQPVKVNGLRVTAGPLATQSQTQTPAGYGIIGTGGSGLSANALPGDGIIGIGGYSAALGAGGSGVVGILGASGGATDPSPLTKAGVKGVGGVGVIGQSTSGAGIGVSGTDGSSAPSFVGPPGLLGNYGVIGVGSTVGVAGGVGAGAPSTVGAIAVRGLNSGTGNSGVGVQGEISSSATRTNTVAVKGINAATGSGAIGAQGQCDGAGGIGVSGISASGLGGTFQGGLAPLRLVPRASGTGAPTTGAHGAGEFSVDSAGSLFYCTAAGTPGMWQQINGGSGGGGVALGAANSATAQTTITLTGSAGNASAFAARSQSTGANTIGITGDGGSGIGVYATSGGSYGLLGVSNAAGFSGCTGGAYVAGAAAFAGGTSTPGAYAAYFTGPVVVDGDFTVLDPARKHGAIKHPDGTHRTLYSMESPKSWIEDFGEARLSGGKAEVKLDADFAAVAEMERYYVFLTAHDESGEALVVTERRRDGFVVKERKGGTGGGAFAYRVVAKPKTEKKAQRMAKFDIPKINIPSLSDLPKPPLAPEIPKHP